MTDVERGGIIEWGWAGRALEGVSGDLHVVVAFSGGALVGLIDGLGHGPEAAAASRAAAAVLEAHPEEPVLSLVNRCHDGLRRTRGAVMSLASFDAIDSSLTWIGVGNVDALLLRRARSPELPDQAIASRPGVVGFQLPPLRSDAFVVSPGDTLIMATDGVRSAFTTGLAREDTPQEMAESVLARFAKGSDDAHVVVARYRGAP